MSELAQALLIQASFITIASALSLLIVLKLIDVSRGARVSSALVIVLWLFFWGYRLHLLWLQGRPV